MRGGRRLSSESSGGTIQVTGRRVAYSRIRPVPEIEWRYAFNLRESGFALDLEWHCERAFHTSEIAALHIAFDLYRSVVSVLGMPDTAGPSGLVGLPLVINAPNHGVVRVTIRDCSPATPVHARIGPFRTRAELWLDLIPGARPLSSGMFEMPAESGRVCFDFEVTRIFAFADQDRRVSFGRWELPPFYSFAERENVLGALCDAWLTGLTFRPDLGRFANNSVADSAALCAPYYAEIAVYTPLLAQGLDPRHFIRFCAEQLLADANETAGYSDWHRYPMTAMAPIECAWL